MNSHTINEDLPNNENKLLNPIPIPLLHNSSNSSDKEVHNVAENNRRRNRINSKTRNRFSNINVNRNDKKPLEKNAKVIEKNDEVIEKKAKMIDGDDEFIERDDKLIERDDELIKDQREAGDEFYLPGARYRKGPYDENNRYRQSDEYAKLDGGDQYYYKEDGKEIYATIYSDEDLIEYPAKRADGKETLIVDNAGRIQYPFNLNKKIPIFPTDPVTGRKKYYSNNGKEQYPFNERGESFYLKDENGDEVVIDKKYAVNLDGTEKYPKNSNNDDYYIRIDDTEIGAKDNEENYYYAKRSTEEEYYPRKYVKIHHDI